MNKFSIVMANGVWLAPKTDKAPNYASGDGARENDVLYLTRVSIFRHAAFKKSLKHYRILI